MPSQYIPILIYALLAAAFPAVTLIVFKYIRPEMRATGAKLEPYECGVPPEGSSRGRYSVRFYIVAILFVIFDVETIFLLPDPALSTGYGQAFIARGHRDWGTRPCADIMAATDAALARPDIDADRVAMMGGSYGGYMANWMAGHTDRFKAIVSHAGLWALDQMFGTTDHPMFWRPQFGDPLTEPEMYEANSPNRHIARIRTPMLVIHGDKDYRVPVGEALRLWWDLSRYGAEAKFLYFPDENHWILTPGNARIWYETVFAFLAQHVLGEPWERPRSCRPVGWGDGRKGPRRSRQATRRGGGDVRRHRGALRPAERHPVRGPGEAVAARGGADHRRAPG